MKSDHNKDFVIVIEKLNNTNIDKINLMGIVSYTLFSREIFPKNKDIIKFLEEVLGLSYLDYVIKSRSLISARVLKHIVAIEEQELRLIIQKIKKYLMGLLPEEDIYYNRNNNRNKKKNANDKLGTWLKGL